MGQFLLQISDTQTSGHGRTYLFPLPGAACFGEKHFHWAGQAAYPTKTVYVVYYQASDGTNYQWKVETGNSRNDANQILAAGESVKRRVLSIKETGNYITVEAELTADTYIERQQQRYLWMIGLSSGSYLVFCLVVWMIIKYHRRKGDTKG